MKKLIMASAFLPALCLPALACGPGNPNCGNQGGQGNQGNQGGGGGTHGVPGPLVGAGLPFIAVGYGAYWLVRRYRRKRTQLRASNQSFSQDKKARHGGRALLLIWL